MIILYTSPGCASCRKAKSWLEERGLPFIERNIFSTLLKEKEIKLLLQRSENGTDDLVSKRSKVMKELDIDIDELSLNELVGFIQKNPSILKRPIMIDDRRFLVGYDEEEIDTFIPTELRNIQVTGCTNNCPHYQGCGKIREASEPSVI